MSLERILWLLAKVRIIRGWTIVKRGLGKASLTEVHIQAFGTSWIVEDK